MYRLPSSTSQPVSAPKEEGLEREVEVGRDEAVVAEGRDEEVVAEGEEVVQETAWDLGDGEAEVHEAA